MFIYLIAHYLSKGDILIIGRQFLVEKELKILAQVMMYEINQQAILKHPATKS